MRGTGFEPADLYRTAPSTLRRWPGLATHARCVLLHSPLPRGNLNDFPFDSAMSGVCRRRTERLGYHETATGGWPVLDRPWCRRRPRALSNPVRRRRPPDRASRCDLVGDRVSVPRGTRANDRQTAGETEPETQSRQSAASCWTRNEPSAATRLLATTMTSARTGQ